jgi:transcriptional regulator with GAF, ATPase, and Fis domain
MSAAIGGGGPRFTPRNRCAHPGAWPYHFIMSTQWLRAADCPLLQAATEGVDAGQLRVVQLLLEIAMLRQSSYDVADALLDEIAHQLRCDHLAIWEAMPGWQMRWRFARPGAHVKLDIVQKPLLNEILDRQAGVNQPPTGNMPALVGACLSYVDRPNRLLVGLRARDSFTRVDLEYAVAAGHYFGIALERASVWDRQFAQIGRLSALLDISQQLAQERETVPLLEHIAAQTAELLHCERASIFLWDKARKELVGRPALGMPNNELRIPDNAGVVGRALATSEPQIVQDVRKDPSWTSQFDKASGFQTRNLLCVPMRGKDKQTIGVLEVLNKTDSYTPEDIATMDVLATQIVAALDNVRELEAIVRSSHELDSQARLAARIVGESTPIIALRGTIERVARTDLPVLILGESGTGKDVVARAVHYSSPRQHHPYIPINCAAIAETLIESELFGHEKGAFTGAHETRAGKFEAASGGTLFLDEIGDLSANGQAKLLRVLEEKVVYRVGGTAPIPVDTRVIAATNRNLADTVRSGKFREDLFYRLTVVTLDLPPLRDRRDDVMVLAEHFMEVFCKDAGRKPLKFSPEARKRLEQHEWPGNIRELRNLLERVAYLCQGERVEAADLAIIQRVSKDRANPYSEMTLAEGTDAFQRDHIQYAIDRANGNMSEAAKLLGLHRPNLYRKMKLLGMEVKM